MTTTLHDEAQVVLPGEMDSRHDTVCRFGHHRARLGRDVRRDPAEGLRQPDLVAKIVGVLQFLEDARAIGARWRFQARRERGLHLDEAAADVPPEPVPARRRRPRSLPGGCATWKELPPRRVSVRANTSTSLAETREPRPLPEEAFSVHLARNHRFRA